MRPSRRGFLAGAAAAVALAPRARASTDVDLAVVGAGAAGLAAARQLRQAGRSFVVLEARNRTGGRAYTDTSLGLPFDAGAQYIHWAERNPWKRIADDLGFPLQEDTWSDPPLVYVNGVRLSEAERARRRGAFNRIWSALSLGSAADKSFADAVRDAPAEVVAAAGGVTQFSLGEDPERVSIADYNELWSGDDYLVPSGYGALVVRHGAEIPVRLDTPVTAIRWDGGGVEVETPGGAVRAGAVVVTVPVGVLKAGGIRFTPELPEHVQTALEGLGMGAYTKIALRLDRAQVGSLPSTDYFEVLDGGRATSFEFWPFGRDLVLAIMGGDHGRRICEAGEPAAIDFVTERLAAMVGGRIRRAVHGGRLAGWWTDPHARGSYSVARPGHLSARMALREPVAERIWFAGEATAGGGAMTVGGATLEGERAARAVLRKLSG
jgi:monoamine oxidase